MYFEIGQIHMMGLFSLRHGGPPRILWANGEATSPDTFQVSTCRASPINTSSPASRERAKGVCWRGFGEAGKAPLPSESKRSSVPSQPSLYSQRFCLHRETTTKSWTVSEDGPDTAPVRAPLSSVLCLSVSTVLLCPIDHLQPRCFTFRCYEGFSSAAAIL